MFKFSTGFFNKSLGKSQRYTAFTLAEVLIVVGIIGIIAELTIPTLVENIQEQVTLTQVKKIYSNLQQVVKLSEIDNGPSSEWDWGTMDSSSINNFYQTYWAPYLKVLKVCSSYYDCHYLELEPWKQPNKTVYDIYSVDVSSRTSLILSDGTFLIIKNYETNGVLTKTIFVDINAAKKPNIFGKDVFCFYIDNNKGLIPYGLTNDSVIINNDCSKVGTGQMCAAKLLLDGWQIKYDYPW